VLFCIDQMTPLFATVKRHDNKIPARASPFPFNRPCDFPMFTNATIPRINPGTPEMQQQNALSNPKIKLQIAAADVFASPTGAPVADWNDACGGGGGGGMSGLMPAS
jgi:hypothetical protein